LNRYFAHAFIVVGLLVSIVSCTPIVRVTVNSAAGTDFSSTSSFLGAVILLAFACLSTVIGVIIRAKSLVTEDPPVETGNSKRLRATLLNLSPLIVLLGVPMAHLLIPLWIIKRERHRDPSLAAAATRLLNFQITWTLFVVVGLLLCVVLAGLFILAALVIFQLGVCIRAAWMGWRGESATFPMSAVFVK
jgi:uncharacterized Tic20 family protein